jgi:hypothetical protein
VAAVDGFAAGQQQFDDITCMVIRYARPASEAPSQAAGGGAT